VLYHAIPFAKFAQMELVKSQKNHDDTLAAGNVKRGKHKKKKNSF
jgi:hypothetical protein